MTNIFNVITTLSGLLIAIAAILATFTKIRSWIANKFISDVKFDKVDKRSELYEMYEKIMNADEQRKEILEKIDSLAKEQEKSLKDLKMSTLRLELGRLLDHEPKNVDTIYRLYDQYIEMGGNSYMVDRIEHWKEEYGG